MITVPSLEAQPCNQTTGLAVSEDDKDLSQEIWKQKGGSDSSQDISKQKGGSDTKHRMLQQSYTYSP